jgi:hypothetical protein
MKLATALLAIADDNSREVTALKDTALRIYRRR